MTTIIITTVIVVLLLFVFIINRGKKQVSFSNPIDGLHYGGTMGFLLGDKYEFCMSRFKHLNLTVDSNDFEDEMYKLGFSSYRSQYVIWGRNAFNNVKEVVFCFDNKKLSSISINIDFTSEGIKDMYGILVSRICRVLKNEPLFSTNEFTKWTSSKGSVLLGIHSDSTCRDSETRLLVQILPGR